MSRWTDPLLLLALALLAVLPSLLPGDPWYTGDLLLYFYPFRSALAGSGALQAPDWSLATASGTPFCADPQALCYDPARLLYAVLDLPRALAAEAGLRLALCGLGTWWFLRVRGARPEIALLAAVPAALGGVSVSLIGRLDKLGALAMVPWMFAAVDGLALGRRWALPVGVAAVVVGATSGGLEVWAMGIGGALLWAALAPPEGARVGRAGVLGRAGLGLALALGLSAALWLPFREVMAASSRGGGISLQEAGRMSAQPAYLLSLALPELYDEPGMLRNRLHPGAPATLWYLKALGPGLLTLLLAAGGLRLLRRDIWTMAAAVGAAALLALGVHTPIYGWLWANVPGFQLWRYPEKFFIPLGFALPALAGLAASQGIPPRLTRLILWLGVGVAVAGTAVSAGLGPHLAQLGPLWGGDAADWVAWGQRVGTALTLHGAALAGAGLALTWRATGAGPRVAAALLAAELMLVHLSVNPTGSKALVAPQPVTQAAPKDARVVNLSAAMGLLPALGGEAGLEAAFATFRASLYPNLPVLDGLQTADSVNAVRPLGNALYYETAADGSDPARYLRMAEAGGATVAVAARPQEIAVLSQWPGASLLAQDPDTGVALYGLGGAAPQVYRTERGVTFPRGRPVLDALGDGSQDARAAVSLVRRGTTPADARVEVAGPSAPAAAPQPWSDGAAIVDQSSPGHLTIQVNGEHIGWLVVLQTWSAGWQATVDGVPTEVLLAQGAYLGVPVPAGAHEVWLTYRAPGGEAGRWISLGSALLFAALLARRRATSSAA